MVPFRIRQGPNLSNCGKHTAEKIQSKVKSLKYRIVVHDGLITAVIFCSYYNIFCNNCKKPRGTDQKHDSKTEELQKKKQNSLSWKYHPEQVILHLCLVW